MDDNESNPQKARRQWLTAFLPDKDKPRRKAPTAIKKKEPLPQFRRPPGAVGEESCI
jgi:hypothetical protein